MMSSQESEVSDLADGDDESAFVKEVRKFMFTKRQGVDTFAADR